MVAITYNTTYGASIFHLLGGKNETYLFYNDVDGACRGLVSDVYIPHATYNASTQSYQLTSSEAFVYQTELEKRLRTLFDQLPPWLDEDCYIWTRKFVCASHLQRAEAQTVRSVLMKNGLGSDASISRLTTLWQSPPYNMTSSQTSLLLNTTWYAPSYAYRGMCEGYVDSCSPFLQRLSTAASPRLLSLYASLGDGLGLDMCEAVEAIENVTIVGSSGVSSIARDAALRRARYPSTAQVVAQLNGLAGPEDYAALNITTDEYIPTWTNAAVDAWREAFATSCPHGFVVPDDPNHARNVWIEGTGCAQACR